MSKKLPPETYNLRVATLEIVRNLLKKKLFKTEKDALLFVCFSAALDGVKSGFVISESQLVKIPFKKINSDNMLCNAADRVYDQFKKFKSVYYKESSEQNELVSS